MFDLIYAKSVSRDLKKISKKSLLQIKESIEDLKSFPNISNIKQLKNHSIANYRLRVGNYRILFDVSWENKEIHILKIGHRSKIY
ncbi:MAG: type II toxin-antitoxin system RelE family toxin [Planctomycetota bacterium]|jgi:mRNA interferase RelE/StbE